MPIRRRARTRTRPLPRPARPTRPVRPRPRPRPAGSTISEQLRAGTPTLITRRRPTGRVRRRI